MQPSSPTEVNLDDLLRMIGQLYVENRVLQQQLAALHQPQGTAPNKWTSAVPAATR